MSTAMSSKRSFVPLHEESSSKAKLTAVIALIGGAIFLAFGIRLDSTVLSIIGFVGFTSSLLYFNSLFWAHVLRNYKVDSRRISQFRKYY